jgi:glycosyltransferase involved in cell wall biosynthesis
VKIAAVLLNEHIAGGGFNQALSAILQMHRMCKGNFDFIVFTNSTDNIQTLNEIGLKATLIESTWKDKIASFRNYGRISSFLAKKFQFLSPIESILEAANVDLAYFVSPSIWALSLNRIPYITTVWDLCHRDSPEFPEVSQNGEFENRERLYHAILPRAYLTLADSELLADRIELRYGVDRNKVLPMPFSPSPLSHEVEDEVVNSVLNKYVLKPEYIFYPAQFWPHKNHFRLLDAIRVLKEEGRERHVVFSGGDKGNLSYVKQVVDEMKIDDQVHILGFVPAEEIFALYKRCKCVCMPSYFGPTNLPPLEAWKYEKPLIYPDIYREQTRDAALYFNPEDTISLASAIIEIDDTVTRMNLIKKGSERLSEIDQDRGEAEQLLLSMLIKYKNRRRCWGNTFPD